MMGAFVFLYSTFPDQQSAATAARALVEARLIACANLLPGVRAIYRYRDEVAEADEVTAIFKLPEATRAAAEAELRRLHPYETPVIFAIPVQPDTATAAWLSNAVALPS